MAVQYVSDFHFPKSPPRPSVQGYAKGGHVKGASTPQCYSKGGSTTPFKYKSGGSVSPDIAKAKVPTPKSNPSWNANDAVSPGSPKRTPPKQAVSNKSAAKDKFSQDGKGTPPATKQSGDVQRMSGWSDFKKGGSTKPAFNRLSNLGHYAHGGKVKASGEKPSGKAGSGKVSAPVAKSPRPKVADSTKSAPGSRVEMKSGTAKASMGGLSRGTSSKKNAAIHAKSAHKAPKTPHAGASGALAGLAQALSAPPSQPSAPGMGPSPPGMSPGMGAPPGMPMGPRAAPPMAGGPPMMADGGAMHVVHHFGQ